ncbi:MAG: DUF1926 domain-containing protein [Deltaproteobacteria bacterium]|nr:DUF1926 domain-containing protein [Deltaproteobacteria bacterium]
MKNFIFCIHLHQPVGNFEHVFEEAYENAYLPLLSVISEYPCFKVSCHISGHLLDWLIQTKPDYIGLLRDMAKRGQVEVMGGGYYEPILAVIPDEDKMGQLRLMSERIEDVFGVKPRGIWLAERIWEPQLPSALARAGVEYVVTDDYHFIKSGVEENALRGYYTTEDQGHAIRIFPGSERLRYLVPFKPIGSLADFFNSLPDEENGVSVYADDAEKFGVWPGTHRWVFKDGWLKNFLEFMAGKEAPRTVTFSEYMDSAPSLGMVYLPTVSYMEMGEWALPREASAVFAELIEKTRRGDIEPLVKRFIHGGIWRNFFSKYPESNWMHKRMLLASKEANASKNKDALMHLYKAQCNDAYWHGVFGGLYQPHLRTAVYENLLKAESIALAERQTVEIMDIDADLSDEIVVRSNDMSLFISPKRGGSLIELDYMPSCVNLSNTLSRWSEAYHMKLASMPSQEAGEGIKSIHDGLLVKEDGLEKYLKFDNARRSSFVERFLDPHERLEHFISIGCKNPCEYVLSNVSPQGVFLEGDFKEHGIHARKGFLMDGKASFKVDYSLNPIMGFHAPQQAAERFIGPNAVEAFFAVELNLILPGCAGPLACLNVEGFKGNAETFALTSIVEFKGVRLASLIDGFSGLRVVISLDNGEDCTLWHFPVETVSQSEAGFERIFQGSCLVFLFPVEIKKGFAFERGFTVAVERSPW